MVAVICWAIWWAQNKFIWNKKISHVNDVVILAKMYLELQKNVQLKDDYPPLFSDVVQDGTKILVKLQENQIKINIDVALFIATHQFGISLVAHDHLGDLVEARTFLWWERRT
uniref:Uncharacterized protein n=1 Tax=Cannabis sativa TaxID=3483 RepID=A0A803PHL1_CANSA